MPQWLYKRVLRTLETQNVAQLNERERDELAEYVANDLFPHLVAVVRDGIPPEEYKRRHPPKRRLFARTPPPGEPPSPTATSSRFRGVSTAPGRGVRSDNGLYEFDTVDGVAVSLHDTDCISLTYTPGPNPTLTARFRYDPDCAPPQLATHAIVVIRFLGAHLLEWDTDPDEADVYCEPGAPGGQVSAFDWDGHRLFTLDLLAVRVALVADAVAVSTEPE